MIQPKHLLETAAQLPTYHSCDYLLGKVPACHGARDDHVLSRHAELGEPQQPENVVPRSVKLLQA